MIKVMPRVIRCLLVYFFLSLILSSPALALPTRPTKYYMADRVISNADFAKLAGWGVNTAMVDFDVNGSASTWRTVFTEAAQYNINIVVWPSDWNNPRADCNWEAPFPVSTNGDITKVKPLLDVASQYSNFIGIINGHESFWTCTNMTFNEMAGLKTQLKEYAASKGRNIKVWNYINGLYSESGSPAFPASQISRIMDVAITWKHCAGGAEGPCTGSGSALNMINSDRARLTAANLDGTVEYVFVMQTFTASGGYPTKFSLSQLQDYSCQFLNTNALDGFGFYTWDAGWWPDLHEWTDLQPAVPYIYNNCTNHGAVASPNPSPTPAVTPTISSAPTAKPGDANGDSKIDGIDYVIWLNHFGQNVSGANLGDFNASGKVDGVDYVIWINNYGK